VVSCSIPARAHCRLTLGGEVRLPEDRRLWDAAIKRCPLHGSVAVEWSTQIPRSSGLSGSTALLAATLACVLAARGEGDLLLDKVRFAELLRDVERHDAGIMCGYQDAYMIAHGRMQRMDFAGKHPVNPGPSATLVELHSDLPFLLITTGVERLSGAVHGPMSERWLGGEPDIVEGIERISELGRLGSKALVAKRWDELSELMRENYSIIARLGGSGDEVDRLVSDCQSSGALAGKLAGAGLGGTVIALTLEPDVLEARLRQRGYRRFMRPQIVEGVLLL
jgi:galactokinase/mevalonate kinase-like predicted kinase